VPGHGSTHLLLVQAWLRSQSELRIHSGLQPSSGLPKRPGGQEQMQRPFSGLAMALAPQGFGLQASGRGVGGAITSNTMINC
jgi:hypothetical protein